MGTELAFETVSAKDAARVTGSSLKQIHRIIGKRCPASAKERRRDRDTTTRMPARRFDCVFRQGAGGLRIGAGQNRGHEARHLAWFAIDPSRSAWPEDTE